MSLRDKLVERVQPFLDPGEQVEQVFLVQSGANPNFMFLSLWVNILAKHKVVAVTNHSIVVLATKSAMSVTKPKSLVQRMPRQTRLGPVSGTLWSQIAIPGDKKTWVHRRYFKDVEAADAGVTGPS